MPRLNFEDTVGTAESIAAAGAPKAGGYFPNLYRPKPATLAELRAGQHERLDLGEQASIALRELEKQRAGAKNKVTQGEIAKRIEEHHARTKRRMAGIAAREAAATAKLETDVRCIDAACEWLTNTVGQGKHIRDMPPPKPAVLPAGIAATIEAKRVELAVNAERRADVEARTALPGDLKAAISHAVTTEAEKGRPSFNPRFRGGRDPSKLADELQVKLHSGAFQTVSQGGIPFLVWLLRDEIEARLHALVDEADLTDAMSDAEQATALAALNAERLSVECEEEALIRMAEAQGMAISRRADADPRAVLMVQVIE